MSTKSSVYYHTGEGDHKIDIHIYKEMHKDKMCDWMVDNLPDCDEDAGRDR